MNSNLTDSIPQLDPPGAGLPKAELFITRCRFTYLKFLTSRKRVSEWFVEERNSIISLAESCNEAAANQRVLINRLRGLEDSSRYWSINMTLDHLRIVNLGASGCIRELLADRKPDRIVSTADVKPNPISSPDVLASFRKACTIFEKVANKATSLKTKQRHAHPWFGPMDAAGWHFLGAFHMRLHRNQILSILQNL